jgi:hypothetical protein
VRVANQYVEKGEYASQMAFVCRICYSLSLPRLFQLEKYLTPCHWGLTVDTPGFELSNHPGLLSFEILRDTWNFAFRRFVYDKKWTKEEVKTYLTLLCINKATVEYFTRCCCNYLLLQDLNNRPGNYDSDVVAFVKKDYFGHPQLYQLPLPPSAWSIGTMDQRVETIMHLTMNTQKAVFKLVLQWASSMEKGKELKKRIKPMIESVQELRLPYISCRMFKNEKKCGFVAENYRVLTMLSPWNF